MIDPTEKLRIEPPNATLKIEGAIGTKTQLNPLFAELLLSK